VYFDGVKIFCDVICLTEYLYVTKWEYHLAIEYDITPAFTVVENVGVTWAVYVVSVGARL
jgi:hypothetical protein